MGHWPTAGLCLSDGFQLYGMYLSAAVAFIVCGVMVWLFLRRCKKSFRWRPARSKRRAVTSRYAAAVCHLYIDVGLEQPDIINMPLFIINELHLPEKLAV